MRGSIKVFFILIILVVGFGLSVYLKDKEGIDTPQNQLSAPEGLKSKLKVDQNFGKLPLYFIKNQGQEHPEALFYAKTKSYTLWVTKKGLVFDSVRGLEDEKVRKGGDEKLNTQHSKLNTNWKRQVSRFQFLGANKNPNVIPLDTTDYKVNRLIGNDQSQWQTNLTTATTLLIQEIYPKIDLKVYGKEASIEYDWMVKPGGNPEDIKFEYTGVKKTRIDKEGNIIISTQFGKMKHKKPFSYQIVGANGDSPNPNKQKITRVQFKKLDKNTYGFKVGQYDKERTLIIDPVVVIYATYLGHSQHDTASGIVLDSNKSVIVVGYTASTGFPTTTGVYQGSDPDSSTTYDAFVTKFAVDGKSLVWSTYLGGNSLDYGLEIVLDESNNAYLVGRTYSSNFPTVNGYQTTKSTGYDVFVSKLSANGTTLNYSTFLGGNGDDYGNDIDIDGDNDVYIAGETKSTNFPTKSAYMTDPGDSESDAIVAKLSPDDTGASSLVYSTYLGGDDFDAGYGIRVSSFENAFVTGSTESTNFPLAYEYQSTNAGYIDVFVTVLSSGSSISYSTYLGGENIDNGRAIDVTPTGLQIYVTGSTASWNFPTKNAYDSTKNGSGTDAFVANFTPIISGAGSLLNSTYLGGTGGEYGYGVDVQGSEDDVYVTGYTRSSNFPTLLPAQASYGGGDYDLFVTKFATNLGSLKYSTYLGGSNSEWAQDLVVDENDRIYLCGWTDSTNFPSPFGYDRSQNGNHDALIVKLAWGIDDLLGTWPGQGVWYRNSDTGLYSQLYPIDADLVVAGDLNRDGIDDMIGSWPMFAGLWVKYADDGGWEKIGPIGLRDLCVGDMNGDGRDDVLGNFDHGVWSYNPHTGHWALRYINTAESLTTGDIDNDGIGDLIGTWAFSPGVWVKRSSTGIWRDIGPDGANDLCCGDMNGDGIDDVVGSFPHGIWYYNPVSGDWTMIYSLQADQIAVADLDGDGVSDLLGLWSSIPGTWVRYSTGTWERIGSSAEFIDKGRMR